MNATQRETFRHCLLEIAEANGSRFGLTAGAFRVFARRFGFDVAEADAAREAEYLTDKSFLAEVPKTISPECRAWRITATGRDALAVFE